MAATAPPYRIVFFGTSEFAVPILEHLAANPMACIAAVVTQPDSPSGRRRRVSPPPAKTAAERLGLDVRQPDKVRSRAFRSDITALSPDFYVVASYGRILPLSLLEIPCVAPLNVHPSLLPRYRGAAPIQRALLDGVTRTGVTIMWMNERMDAGDVLLQAPLEVLPSDNAGSLSMRLACLGAEALAQTLQQFSHGTISRTPQDEAEATYASPITPADALILWTETAVRCHNRVRAMAPRPGATAVLRGRRVKVFEAQPVPTAPETALPGTIVALRRETVRVATGDGCLDLVTVQPEGSRVMSASEWTRGARLAVGDAFELIPPNPEGNT